MHGMRALRKCLPEKRNLYGLEPGWILYTLCQ